MVRLWEAGRACDQELVSRYREAMEEFAAFEPHRRVFVYVHYTDADHQVIDDRLRDQCACDAYVLARLREDAAYARDQLAKRLREVGTISTAGGTWVLDGAGRPTVLDSCSRDLALLEESS